MNGIWWRTAILIGATVLGAGCASTGPAPVEDRSINPSARPRTTGAPASKPSSALSGTYRVQRGDTLYSIAFRHGIDYRELADWNSIPPPYTIYPGRELRLSSSRATTRPPIAQTTTAASAPGTAQAPPPA